MVTTLLRERFFLLEELHIINAEGIIEEQN